MNLTPLSTLQAIHEKILIIFPGALGDFICFLPALQELAEKRKVDLLARSEYADLAPENVATRSLECFEISRLFVPGAEQDDSLKDFFGSYGYIYSWMASGQADFVRRLELLSEGKLCIFPFRPSQAQVHMVDYYLSCVGKSYKKELLPSVALRSDAISWRNRLWQERRLFGKAILVLAPGSGAQEKNWPIDCYKLVAEWWEKSIGGKTLVVLGPVEEEKLRTGNIWGHALVVNGLNLGQLAALIAESDFYLGNDSGVTHLAAALEVQTITIFGPTDRVQWAPRGKRVTVITQNVGCSPCTDSVMKLCPHRSCLTALSAGRVISILQGASKRSPCDQEPAPETLTRGRPGIKVNIKRGWNFSGHSSVEN